MKKLIALFSVLASVCAFGAIDDVTVVASTKGPDKYADGTVVLPGECYALVWSAGEFAGFKADGTLVNAEDKVLLIYSGADEDGKCPLFGYDVPRSLVERGGTISLWLLDTRVYAEDGAVSLAKKTGDKVVTKVEAVAAAAKAEAEVSLVGVKGTLCGATVGTPVATAVPADTTQPTIKSVKVDGDYVLLEVEGTSPSLVYGVAAGETPATLVAGGEKNPVSGKAEGSITLITPKKGDSGFFQVQRK